jgi:hypothetical protein
MGEEWQAELYAAIEEFRQTYKEPYRLKSGENVLTIDLSKGIKPVRTQFGDSLRFEVIDEKDNEYVLLVRKNSRLYKALLSALSKYFRDTNMQGKEIQQKIKVSIVKIGSGKATTYDVKIIEK